MILFLLLLYGTSSKSFSLSTDMKELNISSTVKNEVLEQGDITKESFIDYLEIVNIGFGFISIGESCFYQCKKLKIVRAPMGITSIGMNAFKDCIELRCFEVPEGVTTLDYGTFFQCMKLENVTIPSTLTEIINVFAFYQCRSISRFIVSNLNTVYKASKDGSTLIYNTDTAVVGPNSKTVKIPDEVVHINKYFLNGRLAVTNIDFGSARNLRSIGSYAFRGTAIKEIRFPAELIQIDDQPFETDVLDYMFFPKSLLYVGDVFAAVPKQFDIEEGCKGMQTVNGVIYNINMSRILLIPSTASLLNISRDVKSLNMVQIRNSEFLKTVIVAPYHEEFWSHENVIYTANKTVLLACPGGITEVEVFSECTKIGSSAFRGSKNLQKVNLMKSKVYYLDSSCFTNTNITSLEIPDSVTTIKSYGFFKSKIKTVKLPSLLQSMEQNIFYQSEIQSINFSRCTKLNTFGSSSFQDCYNLETVILPPNLVTLNNNAFSYCTKLSSIKFPQYLTNIDSNCFKGCSNLESIEMTSINPLQINSYAFSGCGLRSLRVSKNVELIGQGSFDNNPSLTEVIFEPFSTLRTIYTLAFKNSNQIRCIELPDSLEELSPGALSQMMNLTNISISSNSKHFKSIDCVLFDVNGTELVSFPGGLTNYEIKGFILSIREKAFFECSLLQQLNFSEEARLQKIGSYTFSGCRSLTSIEIPGSVISVESYAFSGCENLQTVTFEKNSKVSSLETGVFDGCINLSKVNLRDGIQSSLKIVKEKVFEGCSSLTTFDACCVEVFGSSAFSGCKKLKSINFEHVKIIENECFMDCISLTTLQFGNNLRVLGIDSFKKCSKLHNIFYCGNAQFTNSSFNGVSCIVFVSNKYPYNLFGGQNLIKILDMNCHVPSAAFTNFDTSNGKSSILKSVVVFLIENDTVIERG